VFAQDAELQRLDEEDAQREAARQRERREAEMRRKAAVGEEDT